MSIKDKAMIATFSVSQWSARKLDKRVTKEVTEKYHTSENTVRLTKLLLPKRALETISKIVNEARAFHYTNTLPWDDILGRLLTSANFTTYKSKMDSYEILFGEAVDVLDNNFPALYENSRLLLNGLWNPKDYPCPSKIRSKFSFLVSFTPIIDGNDFRVNISELEAKKIQLDVENRLKASTATAMHDLYKRVSTALSNMVNRLGDKDAIFRDSLVTNLSDLCKLLPRLNLLNDQNLETIRENIESQILAQCNPQILREDPRTRRVTANAAQDILDQMEGYTGTVGILASGYNQSNGRLHGRYAIRRHHGSTF